MPPPSCGLEPAELELLEFPELLPLPELPELLLPLSPLPPVLGVLAVLHPEKAGRTSADAKIQDDRIERRITKPLCFGKPTPRRRKAGWWGERGDGALSRAGGIKRTRTARVAQTGLEG